MKQIYIRHYFTFFFILIMLATSSAVSAQEEKKIQPDPIDTLNSYLFALESENERSVKSHYSKHSMKMFEKRKIFPSQMQTESRKIRNCGQAKTRKTKYFAVITFVTLDIRCNPYFLVLERGRWKIDLKTMENIITYSREGGWRAQTVIPHPYKFGLN